jgi:hypothetical protein
MNDANINVLIAHHSQSHRSIDLLRTSLCKESSPGGSHPQALAEPNMSLSTHSAPIIQSYSMGTLCYRLLPCG